MIIVFDLDDTLYDEKSYVKSGFSAVADFMHRKWKVFAKEAYDFMLEALEKKGRGHIFDEVLRHYNIFSKANVKKCLSTYHFHQPKISLFPDAERCLRRFKNYPLYIVTDGNKIVQHKKILALNLNHMVKKVIITYRHGRKNSKPSPYCFFKIAEWEKVKPRQILCIGDDPNKDFIGIKPLGFKTIRILRGEHKDTRLTPHYEAYNNIGTLDELTPKLLKELEKDD